jgi:hypothetical protein
MPEIRVRNDGVLVIDQGNGYGRAAAPYRATGVPTGTSPIYGAGGLFGVCGMDPTLINACVNPVGIEAWLDWVGDNEESPIYDAITYIGSSGYAQAGLCADCGRPSIQECTQTACFGRLCQMTNEHALDQLGMMMNRGVPEVALFGNITDAAGNVLVRQGEPIRDAFTLELKLAAYNLRALVSTYNWTGNPANNLGGHWEYPGLQILVNTGKVDVLTGIACNALDSYLFNYNAVIGAVGAPSIVDFMTAAYRSLKFRIGAADLDAETAEMAFWMHPRHWDCVSDAYACSYGLVCDNMGAATRNDAMALADFRDKMRDTMSVPVDGKWVPVGLDSQIPNNPVSVGTETGFTGDIYLLTKRVNGRTVFWGEFQNLNQTAGATMAWFRQMFGSTPVAITDGGRFMIAATTEGGICIDARIFTKPRLKMITPQWQARIQNVTCIPLGEFPDVSGSGGLYEKGGGPSSKPYMYLYGECGG